MVATTTEECEAAAQALELANAEYAKNGEGSGDLAALGFDMEVNLSLSLNPFDALALPVDRNLPARSGTTSSCAYPDVHRTRVFSVSCQALWCNSNTKDAAHVGPNRESW